MLISDNVLHGIYSNIERYRCRLLEFCREIVANADKLGVEYIILYGSVARGDISAKSDIDLLVLVDGRLSPSRVEDKMLHEFNTESESRFEGDLEVDVHAMRTVIFAQLDEYNPYELNVRREGIVVWRAYSKRDHTGITDCST